MTWEYKYDNEADTTTIYWGGEARTSFEGKITRWRGEYPATDEAREAVAKAIQNAGTPERIRMQFDFNYGFQKRDSEGE